jgi:hypothetical protein
MELLDRYLEAVRKHLPWQRQDDIIAELRANLEAQLEEKEAALGRPLTKEEAEDWLKQLGAPLQMAAHYQPQQYLIGPAIFPVYWYVLKMAFAWCMIIYSIVTVVQVFVAQNASPSALVEAVLRVPAVLMTTAAWVTLVFAAIEYAVTHSWVNLPVMVAPSASWSPGTLAPLANQADHGKKPRSYSQALAEVVFGFLFLIWLLLIPRNPWLLIGPGALYLNASPYHLAPIWLQFFWCIVALNVLQLGWRSEKLLRGTWQKPRTTERIAMSALGLIPLVLLLSVRDHATILLKHPALDQARYGAALDSINLWVYRSVLLLCAISVLQLSWELGRMILNAYRRRVAAGR